MYKTRRARKQKFKQQKKVSLSQLSFRNLFSQKFSTSEQGNVESDNCVGKHKSKNSIWSVTTFGKNLSFSANSHCVHVCVLTTKYNKSGKRPWKCFSISFQNKETETRKKLSWKQGLPVVMNNQSTNSGFIETSLLHCQHYPSSKIRRVEIVLKTAAQKQAAVLFWLVEQLMKLKCTILTTNVHSIWVNTRNGAVWTSENSPTYSKILSNEPKIQKN